MRYLVKAKVKPGQRRALLQAIQSRTLGQGSVAGDEYLHNMEQARLGEDCTARWVETCYCATPLQEERPYWEQFFELVSVEDAHNRENCRDVNGKEPWACSNCDCTKKLEQWMQRRGEPFLKKLEEEAQQEDPASPPAPG
jgi:hypothetical protein